MSADLRTVGVTGAAGLGLASATYKPFSLTFAEVLRLSLRSISPRARSPVFRFVFAMSYLIFAFGFIGFLVGTMAGPNIVPEKMAIVCAGFALLFPVRIFFGVIRTLRLLRSRGPTTYEVDDAGLTRRSDHRLTWHAWAGVLEIRQTSRELVFLFDAGDIAWFPRRAFLDLDHEARFLEIARAGVAKGRPPASHLPRASDG